MRGRILDVGHREQREVAGGPPLAPGVVVERGDQAAVVAAGKDVTYDLKPVRDDPTAVGTKEFADAVIAELGA